MRSMQRRLMGTYARLYCFPRLPVLAARHRPRFVIILEPRHRTLASRTAPLVRLEGHSWTMEYGFKSRGYSSKLTEDLHIILSYRGHPLSSRSRELQRESQT